MESPSRRPPAYLLIVAFLTVYIVWGSTYYFIQQALKGFPPFMLGAVRFLIAGILLMAWCMFRGEKLFDWKVIPHASVGGFLMLFVGNGIVIWVEQTLPSALAAIMVSSTPLWFVILDRPKWTKNFRSASTISGLALGFVGVLLLFGERLSNSMSSFGRQAEIVGLTLLNFGVIAWAGGSLYVKYKVTNAAAIVNTTWQIVAAGLAFVPGVFLLHELDDFHWRNVPAEAWASLAYLIFLGSLAAFSAYVWLLQVRPATQVSTYAYVNPVVAVLLGILLADEKITLVPVIGLAVILISVLLINIPAYRKKKATEESDDAEITKA